MRKYRALITMASSHGTLVDERVGGWGHKGSQGPGGDKGDKCSLQGSKHTKQKINSFHSGTTNESAIRLFIDHRKDITNVLLTWCGWQLVLLTLSRRIKAIGYVM